MKWRNSGHEFDKLGENLQKTKVIYIYGAFMGVRQFYEQLCYAIKKANNNIIDVDIVFVDRNEEKQKSLFWGHEVISPECFRKRFKMNSSDIVILGLSEQRLSELWIELEDMKLNRRFNAFDLYEFYRYLSVFIYYRYKKLYFHLVDIFSSTYCNINCEKCCVQTYRGVRKKVDIEELRKSIDILFGKVDYAGIISFGIAEQFMYGDLHLALDYITENYSDRFECVHITTNGTIIPNRELIESMKKENVHVTVDDYRENVPLAKKNYLKVLSVLKENSISFAELKRTHWDDSEFGVINNVNLDSKELTERMNQCICHAKGFPYYGYKKGTSAFFSCVYQTINTYLGVVDETENDYIELTTADNLELIEFALGYTKTGFLSACKRCYGVFEGQDIKHIPVAVQK